MYIARYISGCEPSGLRPDTTRTNYQTNLQEEVYEYWLWCAGLVYHIKDSSIWKSNNKRITQLEDRQEELENIIARLKKDINAVEGNNLSITQFLNLSKLAGSKLEAADPIAKDRICRMLFLNLPVDEEKVVDLQIREPYATLLKTKNILNGRGDRT